MLQRDVHLQLPMNSSVHISEEASNAAIAVPWAIVSAIGIAGVLGVGETNLQNCHLEVY